MLIGIDASRANRDHKSGTEWYAYYIIRWLAKLDSKNQYILYTDKPLKGGLLDLATSQYFADGGKIEKIKVDKKSRQEIISPHNNFKCKVLKWPFTYFWTQGRLSLEMFFQPPDVLFIPSHALPLIHPKKSIVTIHDIGFTKEKALYRKEDLGPNYKATKKILNLFVCAFARFKRV